MRIKSNGTVSLYRHFSGNKLLYIGISDNIMVRNDQHNANSEWFIMVDRIEVSHFKSRSDALKAEKDAIIKEKPEYNKTHSTTNKPEKQYVDDNTLLKYPIVMAEMERIPVLYSKRWSVEWIANHFGTTMEVIKYVLRKYGIARPKNLYGGVL